MNVIKADRTTDIYKLQSGSKADRERVENWLCGLDLVSADVKEAIVTAWVTTWRCSPHERIEEMPYSTNAPSYFLHKHVVEVGDFGLSLAAGAKQAWDSAIDHDVLVPILLLHDVDKPLMFVREGTAVKHSALYRQLPHGVVGGMLLHDIGFPDIVVNTVATHSVVSPFHGSNFEAFVLHYADLFSADHALMLDGVKPYYQRHLA